MRVHNISNSDMFSRDPKRFLILCLVQLGRTTSRISTLHIVVLDNPHVAVESPNHIAVFASKDTASPSGVGTGASANRKSRYVRILDVHNPREIRCCLLLVSAQFLMFLCCMWVLLCFESWRSFLLFEGSKNIRNKETCTGIRRWRALLY